MAKSSTREDRAEARARRRARTTPDPPDIDEAIQHDGAPSPADALRAAASAAIAGAAVGAAQAFARRRHDEPEDDEVEPAAAPEESESQRKPEAAAEEPPDEEEEEPAEEEEQKDEEPPQPIVAGEAPRIVARARDQLRDLRGVDAESVSSIRRTADGWHVGLEVVELHRIPESTDVLATFEVTLDDDGNLLTFQRARRYYRSEAE